MNSEGVSGGGKRGAHSIDRRREIIDDLIDNAALRGIYKSVVEGHGLVYEASDDLCSLSVPFEAVCALDDVMVNRFRRCG